jgi:hypothetical protein
MITRRAALGNGTDIRSLFAVFATRLRVMFVTHTGDHATGDL